MARLPQPGADDGNWGTILNDYLRQSHKDDGSLKSSVVSTALIQDDAVTEAKLDPATRTKLASKADISTQIATSGSLTGGGNLSATRTLSLTGDNAAPGNSRYYGTDASGDKGFFDGRIKPLTRNNNVRRNRLRLCYPGNIF